MKLVFEGACAFSASGGPISSASRSMARETQCDEVEPVLGQYALLAEIGRGGMGVVFKARHLKLGRLVALKLLPIGALASSAEVARFHQEMEAIGRLDHENIVRAYDAGENEAGCYLAMEYLEGADLAHLVKSVGQLPVAVACGLIRSAARGLQHAHECGLMHRDIKPSNLFLTNKGVLKVLDFGLARLQHREVDNALTKTGCVVGTLDYMSPEQASGAVDLDIRADIYSLGCSLYCLLVGNAPFAGEKYDTTQKKLNAHADDVPISPAEVRDDMPAGVGRILNRMMEKQPRFRFSTPAEVASALSPFASMEAVEELLGSIAPRPTSSVDVKDVVDYWRHWDATTKSLRDSSTRAADEPSTSHGLRRFLLNRRTWIAAASLGAAAAAVPLLLPEHDTTPPLASEPEWWTRAFAAPPEEVYWPSPKAKNTWEFLSDADRSLRVTTYDTRLLGFGKMPDGEFRLSIRVQQLPWEGRFGLFFGCQPFEFENQACFRMQMLTFTLLEREAEHCTFRVYRKNVVFQPYRNETFVSDFEQAQILRIRSRCPIDLSIRMGLGGWQSVVVQSNHPEEVASPLTELTSDKVNGWMVDRDYPMRGSWGIFNYRVVTVFSKARLNTGDGP